MFPSWFSSHLGDTETVLLKQEILQLHVEFRQEVQVGVHDLEQHQHLRLSPTACQQQHSICVWECVLCGLALTGCQWWESFVFFRCSHTSSITCRDIQQQRLSAAPKGKIKQLHVYKNLLYPQSDWYLCCYYINSSLICSYMCGVGVFIWQHTQKLATNELIIQVKLVVMIL